jgi:hypothetical protein
MLKSVSRYCSRSSFHILMLVRLYHSVDAILACSISAMLSEFFSWDFKHVTKPFHRQVRMSLMRKMQVLEPNKLDTAITLQKTEKKICVIYVCPL